MPPKRPDPNAGRDISFTRRDFSAEERNFFLYRTVFILVNIGIPGIDKIIKPTITDLLKKPGKITDEQVNKMIWMVCNFAQYLEPATDARNFIQLLDNQYAEAAKAQPTPISNIAKSIATLIARVFVAIQMRVNLGIGGGAAEATGTAEEAKAAKEAKAAAEAAAAAAAAAAEEAKAATLAEAAEAAEAGAAAEAGEKAGADAAEEVVQSIIEPVLPLPTPPVSAVREPSERVKLMNAKIAEADAAIKAKKAAAAAEAAAERARKIQEETDRLNKCIEGVGISIKFVKAVPDVLYTKLPSVKYDLNKFYKLLPLVLARIESSITRRLANGEIKSGPGTVDTLKSLGLPDPKINIDDDDDDGGGAGRGGGRKNGITKRKKNTTKTGGLKVQQKIFYGGNGVKARTYVEHAQPIPQCDSTVDNYHEYVNPTCYICGEPWIEGLQSSMECEHILCVIHGIEYFGLLQSVYLSPDQKEFLSILYAWAHRCCNQRKKNIAFIRKNPNRDAAARKNFFVPDDVNIRQLLADIHTVAKSALAKQKFDCTAVLAKVKESKKDFVDRRTSVVTSYVTPLVACVNSVFTTQFQENMVLFNAIGCLKIMAEMCIYLTASSHKQPELEIDMTKASSFMSDLVFPKCLVDAGGGQGGGSIYRGKKTRKSLRRKIQRGGAGEVHDFFSGIFSNSEKERCVNEFKDSLNILLDTDAGLGSSIPLSDMLHRSIFESDLSTPIKSAVEPQEHTTKIDAILFILFILNHYRNPTILFELFLTRNNGSLIEITRAVARKQLSEDTPLADEQATAEAAEAAEAAARNHTTNFIIVCKRVFAIQEAVRQIFNFLKGCDKIPGFMGVVGFLSNKRVMDAASEPALLQASMDDKPSSSVTDFNTRWKELFKGLCTSLQPELLFSRVEDAKAPLEHLVNACFHLKTFLKNQNTPMETEDTAAAAAAAAAAVIEKAWSTFMNACELFPSCLVHDDDPFSHFGPCLVYNGILPNTDFQNAMGCFALTKRMVATEMGLERTSATVSMNVDQCKKALDLCRGFFSNDEIEILEASLGGVVSDKPEPTEPGVTQEEHDQMFKAIDSGIIIRSGEQVDLQKLAIIWAQNLALKFNKFSVETLKDHIQKFILPEIITKAHESLYMPQTVMKSKTGKRSSPLSHAVTGYDDNVPSKGKRGRNQFIQNLRMFLIKIQSMNSDNGDSMDDHKFMVLDSFINQIDAMLEETEEKKDDEEEEPKNEKINTLLNDIIMVLSSPPSLLSDSESDDSSMMTSPPHAPHTPPPEKVIEEFRGFIHDYQPENIDGIIEFLRDIHSQSGGSTHTKHNHTKRKNRNARRNHKSTKTSKYIRKNKYKSNTKKNRKNRR